MLVKCPLIWQTDCFQEYGLRRTICLCQGKVYYLHLSSDQFRELVTYQFSFYTQKLLLSAILHMEVKDIIEFVKSSYLEYRQIPEHLWAPPVGALKARVGFILDFDIQSTHSKRSQEGPWR